MYEATCSVVERLIVSVDVERDGGKDTSLWQAVLLFPPSATLMLNGSGGELSSCVINNIPLYHVS